MIKYNLKELITQKEFAEKRTITITEIANDLNVSRNTLYRIANSKGDFSTKTEYIEKLCRYFECTPNDLMSIIPDPSEHFLQSSLPYPPKNPSENSLQTTS